MDSPSARISEFPDFETLYFVLFVAIAIAITIWILLRILDSRRESSQIESESLSSAVDEPENLPDDRIDEDTSYQDPVEAELGDEFQAASEKDAASHFSTELSSGVVKQDPVYGIIYVESPDKVDNLKEIKGVGKVLEGRLHGIGVYRYKQIGVWTDAACEEFSKLLTFKNRIYQDNWIAQAKALHHEKYDEEL